MKLALALTERKQLQETIRQLSLRLNNNAQVQEGETPAEDPQELIRRLDESYAALENLMARVNLTNAQTCVGDQTLTELLAARECGEAQLRDLRAFLDCASSLVSRRTVGEIRIKSTVDVRALQKQADLKAKALRELDARIQEANWTTELL